MCAKVGPSSDDMGKGLKLTIALTGNFKLGLWIWDIDAGYAAGDGGDDGDGFGDGALVVVVYGGHLCVGGGGDGENLYVNWK